MTMKSCRNCKRFIGLNSSFVISSYGKFCDGQCEHQYASSQPKNDEDCVMCGKKGDKKTMEQMEITKMWICRDVKNCRRRVAGEEETTA